MFSGLRGFKIEGGSKSPHRRESAVEQKQARARHRDKARRHPAGSVQTRRLEMKHVIASVVTGGCLLIAAAGTAFAASGKTLQTPTTGHKGGPAKTCSSATPTPGASATAQGSPFNENGTAGGVYAGNPGTASLANSNS